MTHSQSLFTNFQSNRESTEAKDSEQKVTFHYQDVSEVQRFQRTFLDKQPGEEMARQVAKLILLGTARAADEAVALVKNNPAILNYTVEAKDSKNRTVKRKPLQIAAMAGDFDLGKNADKDYRGLAERLALAGRLSTEEVSKQLEVITSREAKLANEKRCQRIVNAVKEFGESIIRVRTELDRQMNFEELQTCCQQAIDQFEKALQPAPNEVITSGYIFDIKILQEAMKWFEKNAGKLGGRSSTLGAVFRINCLGKLQDYLSARDKQVIKAGICDVSIPNVPRDSSSQPSAILGQNFYYGVSGERLFYKTITWEGWGGDLPYINLCFDEFLSNRTAALQNLGGHNPEIQNDCSIM